MGRGVISGLIFGAIASFAFLLAVNEVAPPVHLVEPALPEVASPTPVPESTPEEAETEQAPDLSADLPSAEPDRSGAQPDVNTPEADIEAVPETSEQAAPAPDVVTAQGPQDTGVVEGNAPTAPSEESPVLVPPQVMAPEAAAPDSLPQVDQTNVPELTPLPDGADQAPVMPESPQLDLETPAMIAPDAAAQDTPAEEGAQDAGVSASVVPFTERPDPRKSTRLPSIGSEGETEMAAAEPPVVVADDLPALLAYSAEYDRTPAGPMMSIILVDIGDLGPADAMLSQLPFPVSYAVDVLGADAGARALEYRDQGLEVLAMVSLPEGATPQDAAVTLSQAEDLIPVSIGFLDVPSGSFQASRQVAAEVIASARDSGRGVVSFPRGLNALEQEAQRSDAPMALVFRDFDGKGQDIAAMKRFLDQAAFRAGIDSKIVLVGRSKPDTIQALAEWALGSRAAAVSIVPLSYLLTH